jgi:hypothetical protein
VTTTRRDLVALAAAALVARSSPALAAAPDDAELLLRLIAREDDAAAVHDSVVASQERDHAAALRTLLDALGRQAPRGAASAPSQDLVALETSLIDEYRSALLDLRDPSILRTAGTILASHSQHRVKARIEAGLDPFTSDP